MKNLSPEITAERRENNDFSGSAELSVAIHPHENRCNRKPQKEDL